MTNKIIIFISLYLFCITQAYAEANPENPIEESAQEKTVSNLVGKETNLPLPRFVTIKAKNANLRNGPSNSYPIKWIYQRQGYPMQVIAEFQNWRQIKDVDGEEGWVHEALISSKRNVLIVLPPDSTDKEVLVHRYPDNAGRPIARLQKGVLAAVRECDEKWCYINISDTAGWVEKRNLWGILDNEVIKR